MDNNKIQNIDYLEMLSLAFQYLVKIVGILLIVGGSYLGYISFEKAKSILENPSYLVSWLELEKKFPTSPVTIENRKLNSEIKNQDNDISTLLMIYELKGYIIIFLSFLYLWILAKIAISFVKAGGYILLQPAKKPDTKLE